MKSQEPESPMLYLKMLAFALFLLAGFAQLVALTLQFLETGVIP